MPTTRISQSKRPPFSWAQPCCVDCWIRLKLKTGRIKPDWKRRHLHCCFCRKDIPKLVDTYEIRINPGTVPYPTLRKEEE